MHTETEIKVSIPRNQVNNVLTMCRLQCSSEGELVSQQDEYFDTAQESLRSQDFTVRLRTLNDRMKLALKGPRMYLDGPIHSRIELEFTICDENEVRDELRGLSRVALIEKRRWTFQLSTGTVAVDEVPFVGAFLEVEAESPEDIDGVLNVFNLTRDNATKSNYTELLESELPRFGLPIRPNLRATFEEEKRFVGA